MSTEAIKAVGRKFFEEFARGNLQAVADLMSEDHVFHYPLLPGPVDKASHVRGQAAVKVAFPDFNPVVIMQIAEGDMLFNWIRITGTQNGPYMGRPASGRTFDSVTYNVMRIRDGQVVEEWDEFDTLGHLVQLGIVEKPK